MSKSIAPANQNAESCTAVASTSLSWFLSLPARLWRHYRRQGELRTLLDSGHRLIADAGMRKEDVEELSGAPFWQSAHLPPLRHF